MKSMLILLLTFTFLISTSCQQCKTPIVCQDYQTQEACDSKIIGPKLCYWNGSQCADEYITQNTLLSCEDAKSEFDCLYESKDQCNWVGTTTEYYDEDEMKVNKDGKCEFRTCSSAKDRDDCRRTNGQSCDWISGKCVEIKDCKQAKTNNGCMINYFRHRCISLKDGKPYYGQKSTWEHITDTEPDIECETYTCRHSNDLQQDCVTFVNGFLCFDNPTDGCSTCSDYDSKCKCIETNECTWQEEECREIQCEDLKSPQACETRSKYCSWNEQILNCQLQNRDDVICFPENNDYSKNLQIFYMLLIVATII